MQKFFTYLILPVFLLFFSVENAKTGTKNTDSALPLKADCLQLYKEMNLDSVINYTAFEYAYAGYNRIDVKNKEFMTLIDFSKPSTEERFYVFDMFNKKLVYATYVAHGKKSGEIYATSFSNKPGSHKSAPGFYITENTYQGRNGYSLALNGLEKGINDRARERSIVIHGAAYCDTSFNEDGRLGRSFGCLAVPEDICEPIIDTIKDGTLLCVYTDDKNYLNKSRFVFLSKVRK